MSRAVVTERSAELLLVLALAASAVAPAEKGSVTVAGDAHRVEILQVERHQALMDGMLRPEDPDEAFLLVYLKTDDPCLDPRRAATCFDEIEADEKLAWACGRVVLDDGEERRADGGGLLDGEQACSYVVPRRTARLVLELRGYPQIELEPSRPPAE